MDPPAKFVAPLPVNSEGRPSISRLLIANRGEIACRIINTCRKLNVTSVAIYVDEDDTSQHITSANESVGLGSIDQPGGNPYLNIDLIVRVAVENRVDAIHPGYGYLSENAAFATAVRNAGITFVGPSPSAMETLGDKRSAKAHLRAHEPSVPLIPGFAGTSQEPAELERLADEIGYPVMLKASAGGGGKGMRIVQERGQLRAELETARSEAARYFGSSDCILEKYIEQGKHIEIQIMGDGYGNVLSLGERDCSVQRRHQKVIEEAPSPWLDDAKRKEMSNVAVTIGRLLNYENAGTVEFVFDVATGNFYFLEVNTRLQVEHPITEEVTRLDIVSLQLFVAGGGDLTRLEPLRQVKSTGHAIECRLCAESPQRDFYPGHGIVRRWRPATAHGEVSATSSVRFETGIKTGSRISIHFDSMIAKIVVWEPTRALARAKMIQVLADTACVGVGTNQLFLQSCLLHEKFSDPAYTTSFIPDNLSCLLSSPYAQGASQIASALPLLASYFMGTTLKTELSGSVSPLSSIPSGFRNQSFDSVNHSGRRIVVVDNEALTKQPFICSWSKPRYGRQTGLDNGNMAAFPEASAANVTARYNELSNALRLGVLPGQQSYGIAIKSCTVRTVRPLDQSLSPWYEATVHASLNGNRLLMQIATESSDIGQGGISQAAKGVRVMCHVPQLGTWTDMTCFSILSYFEHIREETVGASSEKRRHINAPMPCKVLAVLRDAAQTVESGDKVMVVESMKMEINIFASVEGVFRPMVSEGDAVDEGRALCVIE
ncbi:hypothetical protein H634G_07489 [Metarhizium anisopliae BRIP 53293]|uniref:Methylcrotonoyl-CoA carboxylase subunit alpha n=1 Tax=Metarhizium anisopliae BRIP 53293 TaxID=1291518 RepID=A0A0D9NT14_METAN|nr:hypothetical protein H634G_07489 [Metarhizium anisopliae BRIP 53293]KJK96082.1 hypothetical protein H633G_00022 [Metarhizium anisopliae BRIP 53284]